MSRVDLSLIDDFLVLAEEMHVGRAARRLFISQPAMTKKLRRLEDDIGVPLVRRVGRGIELTRAGAELVVYGRSILEAAENGIGRVRAAGRATDDAVVVRIVHPLPPALTSEMLRYSAELGVLLTLQHGDWLDQIDCVLRGDADLSIIYGPVDGFERGDQVTASLLFEEERVAGFSLDHKLSGRSSLTFADIADEPILRTSVNWDFWAVDPRPDGAVPTYGPTVRSAPEILEVVAAGEAIALPAVSFVEAYPRSDIAWVPVEELPPAQILLVERVDEEAPGVVRVRDELLARGRSLADGG